MFKKLITLIFSSLTICASEGQIAKANGVDIWYETFGDKENPALLLISGGCNPSTMWHDSFCQRLVNEGFYVIRYDHRDTGLSSSIDFEKAPYDLMDMAKDAIGVLDAARIQQSHLFGLSLGGYLSEILAAYYPERVHTITVMASTVDIRPANLAFAGLPPEEAASLPPPTAEYLAWMKEWTKLSPQTDEERLTQRLEGWNKLNGDVFPLDVEMNREIHQKFLARDRYPQGILNHIAMLKNGKSEELIRTVTSMIKVPTVILHGSEDPLSPPVHGAALHDAIKGSEYFLVEGMGHVPNELFFDLYIDILKRQKTKSR